MHVPKEKRRKLDAKSEKCILVGYLDEQKDYKCYNPLTKHARVSRDVVFDESASWYFPSSTNLDNSIPISEDEVNEAEMPLKGEEIRALEESPISFRLSGPNERLSRHDQSDEQSASSGDSIVHSPQPKSWRWLTRKEKGKKKMSEYDIGSNESDQSESVSEKNKDGPSEMKSESAKRALK